MRLARLQHAAIVGAAVLLLTLAGCGKKKEEQGIKEPAREGLGITVGGIDYNVFITRELNLKIAPDKAYYAGPPPKPSHTYYGVFLEACNKGKQARQTVREFRVTDSQGKEFEPLQLPASDAFAYTARKLTPGQCIPEAGSVAQQGPTAASMLLFDFPLATTENRPLELELRGPYDVSKGKREIRSVELDL